MTPKFVKIGVGYYRPEDVKRFYPHHDYGWTRMILTNGDEFNIHLAANEVAAILNGSG